MGIKTVAEKLDKYNKRLGKGQVSKIKPAHVDKTILKLQASRNELLSELAEAEKPSKQERIKSKIELVDTQLERANWLKEHLAQQ